MRRPSDGKRCDEVAIGVFAVTLPNRRLANYLGFVVCGLLIVYAYYTEFFQGLEPCPLCIYQRVGVVVMGLIFLTAALHHPPPSGSRAYSILIALIAITGAVVSARHVWLQHLPADQVPACGPGLEYIFDVFSFSEALTMVFSGSGECADVSWQFLGLGMPAWVLIFFLLLGVAGVTRNWTA